MTFMHVFFGLPMPYIRNILCYAKLCAKGLVHLEPRTTKEAEYPAPSRCLIFSLSFVDSRLRFVKLTERSSYETKMLRVIPCPAKIRNV